MAMLSSIVLLAVQATTPAPALPPLKLLPDARGCQSGETSDVVVCARNDARHRLPLPAERDTARRDGPVRGEPQRASVDGPAPCGIFAGQRNCGKAEAARYGYGGGRDPVTVGAKALRRIFDADADLGDPPPVPRGR